MPHIRDGRNPGTTGIRVIVDSHNAPLSLFKQALSGKTEFTTARSSAGNGLLLPVNAGVIVDYAVPSVSVPPTIPSSYEKTATG